VLAAIAEFERDRIRERVLAGLVGAYRIGLLPAHRFRLGPLANARQRCAREVGLGVNIA
jgi:DNA invertase Pin-like site-specific DNA recombinase